MSDLTTPLPDLAHESLRQAVVTALTVLTEHVQQLADAFLIGETAADGLTIALQNVVTMQAAVTDLAARVAKLEAAQPAPAPTPTPSPSPTP